MGKKFTEDEVDISGNSKICTRDGSQRGYTTPDKLLAYFGGLPPGPIGPQGPAGGDGPSAYEVAVANGFVGTEAEWLESLIGPQGPQGPQGIQGEQGPQGDAADIASEIDGATENTAPVDTDRIGTVVGGVLKHLTLLNLWAYIKAKLDGVLTLAGAKTFSGQVELTGQTAANDTSAMTRIERETDDLFAAMKIMRSWPVSTVTATGATNASFDGQYCSIGAGTTATGIGVAALARGWIQWPGSGSSIDFGTPWRISNLHTFHASDETLTMRVYVGHTGATAEIPYSGNNPVPAQRRSIGYEVRQKPSSSGQRQIRLFARDGHTESGGVDGTMLMSEWKDFGTDSSQLNSFTHIVLEHLGNGTVNLYLQHFRYGSIDVRNQRTSRTPFLSISGAGVPTDRKAIITNWANIVAALTPNGVNIPSATSAGQFASRETIIQFL